MEKSIILANDISQITRLYEFIEELGNEFSLSPDTVFNLNLVLEEAVVNIINYAYPKEEHQYIYLSYSNLNCQEKCQAVLKCRSMLKDFS